MKNVKIEEIVFNDLKKVCIDRGLKIYKFVSDAILEKIANLEKNSETKKSKKDMS